MSIGAPIDPPPKGIVSTYETRPVKMMGSVTNATSHPVALSLVTDVVLSGIDTRGEEVQPFYAEYTYEPPPGTIRPFDLVLEPGDTTAFAYSDDETIESARWREMTHIVINDYYAFGPQGSFVEADWMPGDCWPGYIDYGEAVVERGGSVPVVLR